jgi:hypothetical protein
LPAKLTRLSGVFVHFPISSDDYAAHVWYTSLLISEKPLVLRFAD